MRSGVRCSFGRGVRRVHPLARHPVHDRSLRIGMLAPIAWRVPPRHYGPWERVVSLLTEGLVGAGVDVTLFATADSLTGAHLSAVVPSPYEETPGMDAKVWEGLHLAHAFGQAQDFDLIHKRAFKIVGGDHAAAVAALWSSLAGRKPGWR